MLSKTFLPLSFPLYKTAALLKFGAPFAYKWIHSKTSNLNYIPHAFDREEAIKRINAADSNRFFAPLFDSTKEIIPSIEENQPLKKVLVPMCGINAVIFSTFYQGTYGVDREQYSTDSKGNTTSYIVTDWYNVSGRLNSCSYSHEYSYGMTIYAGSTYHDKTIEDALERHPLEDKLQVFDVDKIKDDVMIDCFDKKEAYSHGKANDRLYNAEVKRAETDIENRQYCNHVSINSLSINSTINLKKSMLPIYIMKYPNCPIRVLPAISEKDTILHGAQPTSDLKVIATATTTATFFSLLLPPHVSIPARALIIMLSSVSSGLLSHYKLSLQNSFHESRIRKLNEENDEVSATSADEERLKATSADDLDKNSQDKQTLDLDKLFFDTLDLSPYAAINEAIVREAARKKLLKVHPDVQGGSDEACCAVIKARDTFIEELRRKNPNNTGKHYFATYVKRSPKTTYETVKQPPRSVAFEKTDQLITAVFSENYSKARALIKEGYAHPDGHDHGENTLLTEAVKQKNLKAVRFALEELKCSPDSSCDCPLHNTAMHYAVSEATNETQQIDTEIIKLLIKHGARVNLINSLGHTPLDIARIESVKQLLLSHNAQRHTTQLGITGSLAKIRGFFGYSANQRTLLDDDTFKQLPESSEKNDRLKP